mgnify:CR=1 FL=1
MLCRSFMCGAVWCLARVGGFVAKALSSGPCKVILVGNWKCYRSMTSPLGLVTVTAVVKSSTGRSIIQDEVFGSILASHICLVTVRKRYGMTLFNCVYREVFRHCSILFTYDLMLKTKTIAPRLLLHDT